jgi:hypothetical protein
MSSHVQKHTTILRLIFSGHFYSSTSELWKVDDWDRKVLEYVLRQIPLILQVYTKETNSITAGNQSENYSVPIFSSSKKDDQ